jgi:motility quorum-sensing regulator/GCU-specific mRNA interferase toxin
MLVFGYPYRVNLNRGQTYAALPSVAHPDEIARLGAAAFTRTALDGGRGMGLTTSEMLKVIASLSQRNFYKSMTTYADHHVWQDVYHAETPVKKDAYIKITLRDTAPVIQFKEK